MPPPERCAVLLLNVLFETVSVLFELYSPPPSEANEAFPLNVLSTMDIESPMPTTPPPTLAAVLSRIVLCAMERVPPLLEMPPPSRAAELPKTVERSNDKASWLKMAP